MVIQYQRCPMVHDVSKLLWHCAFERRLPQKEKYNQRRVAFSYPMSISCVKSFIYIFPMAVCLQITVLFAPMAILLVHEAVF